MVSNMQILAFNSKITQSESYKEKYLNEEPCFFCGDDTTGIHKLGTKYVWSHVNCIIHEHIMNRNKLAHYKKSFGVSQGILMEK